MTTLTAALDSMVLSAYSPEEKTASITTGLLYASGVRHETVADGDSDNSDLAVAMFAAEVLKNGRNHIKARNDNTVIVKTLDQMWTKQMNDLLFTDIAEKSIKLSNKNPSQFAPNKKWQDGSSQASG